MLLVLMITSIYGPTENITILTTLIGNISNISTKIIETRNRTITELSNNIDNFTKQLVIKNI